MKLLSFTCVCLLLASTAIAQQPRGGQGGRAGGARGGNNNEDPMSRLLALDKNQDGQLAEDEVTDRRLRSLFERADADKDKVVTKEELQKLIEKESKSNSAGRNGRGLGGPGGGGPGGGGPGDGGPGGFGGGPGGGPGGFGGGPGGGPGGPGGPMPKPGTVLPDFIASDLNLSEDQRGEIAKLQKLVDERLASILTVDQQSQLKQMSAGPGGPGGPGPGGRGRREQ